MKKELIGCFERSVYRWRTSAGTRPDLREVARSLGRPSGMDGGVAEEELAPPAADAVTVPGEGAAMSGRPGRRKALETLPHL
jgi:hypothetical protein